MQSRISLWIITLSVLTIAPMGLEKAYAVGSCEPLKRLLVLADTQFKRLRGFYDPRFQAWVATYRMPGASICTIQDAGEIAYYSCKWTHDPKAGTVPEAYRVLLQQVTRCVDVRASSQHDTGPDTQVTRFGIAGAQKTIVVGKSESTSGGHFVTLNVVPVGFERMGQTGAPAGSEP